MLNNLSENDHAATLGSPWRVESFVLGGLSVLTVIIAFRLGMGDEGTGILNAAVGVGGLVGAVVSGVLVLRRSLARPILIGAGVMAVGVSIVGLGIIISALMV